MLFLPQSKINIGLNITEKRPDGYHNLETIFYPIALSDSLQIERDDSISDIEFSSVGLSLDCALEDNLIVRVYRLFQSLFSIGGVRVQFEKRVPFGAGLGGGSADAAAMAKALNQLFHLQLSTQRLRDLVGSLGADCAFFIESTPQYATGIGDELSPIGLDLKGYYLVLVKPNMSVSTALAYRGIVPKKMALPLKTIIHDVPIEQWKDRVVNDFEQNVFQEYPQIADIKSQLYTLGAIYASMTGSGAAVYGIFKNRPVIEKKKEYFYFEQQL